MAEALYRTYRPRTFAEVVDQQHVRITLQHALAQDRVAHAYLFAGPRGVGKTTLARILARAVNCPRRQADGEPCNACPSCLAMLANSNLDLIEIDAASQTGVDNVRENIIQSARSIPSMAKRKVFIIDEVHMLSTAAFNALLKLLEEPPAHAMFILATTEVHRIPETIISRTQRFDFKKIALDDLIVRLQKVAAAEHRQLDDEVVRRIARRAGGSVRDAETMLGQLFSFEDQRITNDIADLVLPRSDQQLILDLLTDLVARRTAAAITRFHQFCEAGGDIDILVHDLILTARGLLLGAIDPTLIQQIAPEFDRADVQRLNDLAQTTNVSHVQGIIEAWLEAERRLSRAVMAELPVELAIITSTTAAAGSAGQAQATTVARDQSRRPPTKPQPPVEPTASGIEPGSADKTAKPPANKGGQMTLQAVRQAWQAIQRTIGRAHPSLGLSVQHATIGDINDQEVILHVPFKLHADRLSDPKYSTPLIEALSEALGQKVWLSVMTIKQPAESPAPARTLSTAKPARPTVTAKKGDLWEQVVASFGKV